MPLLVYSTARPTFSVVTWPWLSVTETVAVYVPAAA